MPVKLPSGWTLRLFETVTSTMNEARHHLKDRCVILANCQTQGRGRHQRTWVSEPGNVFCSLVIRPLKAVKTWPELTFVTALAVGDLIDHVLPNCDFLTYKWPNDILLNNQKVSGILLEVFDNHIIIGLGINLISCPQEGKYSPTYLANFTQDRLSPLDIVSIFVSKFQNFWSLWEVQGFAEICTQWLRRAAFKNQEIELTVSSLGHAVIHQGCYQGIDDQGNLILKLSDGRVNSYSSGDVSLHTKHKCQF